MQNLKDKLSTICGLLFVVCGAIVGVQTQVVLPAWLTTAAIITAAICGAVTAYLTGKRPDGGTKTPEQIAIQNGEVAK